MTAPARVGISLMTVALSGSIAFELAHRHSEPAETGAPHQIATPIGATPTGAAQALHATDVDSDLGAILARPIFNPDRRPVGPSTQSVAGLSRLTGILITPARKIAIFAAPPGGRPLVAEEGTHINAYEVRAISASGVTILGPAGLMVVTPSFDPAPPPPAAAAKPAATMLHHQPVPDNVPGSKASE